VNDRVVRLSATVPAELLGHLQRLAAEARGTGGARLPQAAFLQALLRVLVGLDVDMTGVRNASQLEERIWQAVWAERLGPADDGDDPADMT
jgi:hypothetical protein